MASPTTRLTLASCAQTIFGAVADDASAAREATDFKNPLYAIAAALAICRTLGRGGEPTLRCKNVVTFDDSANVCGAARRMNLDVCEVRLDEAGTDDILCKLDDVLVSTRAQQQSAIAVPTAIKLLCFE